MAVKTDYKVGDKVVLVDGDMHGMFPEFYPEVGTVGTVLGRVTNRALVKWKKGSTTKGDTWLCDYKLIIPAKEKEKVMRNYSTADVAEVKHGEWAKDDSDGCFCSFCGWYTDYDYDYVTNNGLGNDDFIYCSHCGARMDGGTNDEM